jgi:hypothetical protein
MPTGDENAAELKRREDKLFNRKSNLDALNQELAYNFWPERADFTTERSLGTEYAIDLFDSAPVLSRRDLGNARASMLRPRGQEWAKVQAADEGINERTEVAAKLDQVNHLMRTLMYQQKTGFVRAQKEADQFLVTFGNAVQSVETIMSDAGRRQLLVRNWHLRDVVWLDDENGVNQDFVARRFKASARHIIRQFPKANVHREIKEAAEKEPDKEFKLCHVMMRADEYSFYKKPGRKAPWASVYYDSDHQTLLREAPSTRFRYVVQRWETLTGTQYAISPAALTTLSDARGMQMMARILLEAGEKALDPPMKATRGAVKSEIDMGASGITWVDKAYDEKMGPAIEPLLPHNQNIAIGAELIQMKAAAIKDGWYLTKLNLPQQAKTAFETAQLVEEFIRANIPLFEPWEADTEAVLSAIFDAFMDMGAFGPAESWPRALSGSDLEFTFSNPLQDAMERNKVNQATTVLGLVAGARQINPDAGHAVDVIKMVQDGARGSGGPADWITPDDQLKATLTANAAAGNVVAGMQAAGQAAQIVGQGADAAAKVNGLLNPAQPADQQVPYGPT